MDNNIIKQLPDSVANQIAAGEVVNRPSSVIKELVENAVDAGATRIDIIVTDGGRTLMQVIDNGTGMSEIDARMAFERHATSKIRSAEDLSSLSTMGFRGEALPSICAISQVELRTRTAEDRIGNLLVIHGSEVVKQEPVVCDKGSNIMVKNIFFNTPARRKFLKSDSVESAAIMREFERLALVNNNLHLTLRMGAKEIDLRPANFKTRITDLWKNNLNPQLLPIDIDTDLVKIHGYVCRPEHARRRNPLQYLIVNGRNMRHPYFHKAIVGCYSALLAPDYQPCYFLKFEVDPATIDVNVHPTKDDIKFEYDQEIWRILSSAVKTALGKFDSPAIDFDSDALSFDPARKGDFVNVPDVKRDTGYNPFNAENAPFSSGGRNRYGSASVKGWEQLYSDFKGSEIPSTATDRQEALPLEQEETSPICIQFAKKYIITTSRDGLLVIDQYRAHVRIIFDSLMEKAKNHQAVSQQLMFPEPLTLDRSQQLTLESVDKELVKLGFKLEYQEGNIWQITSVPSVLKNANPAEIIINILDSVSDTSVTYGTTDTAADPLLADTALAMARVSAIKGGTPLSGAEMEQIISSLFSLPQPNFTPDGNLTYTAMTEASLQSLLNR